MAAAAGATWAVAARPDKGGPHGSGGAAAAECARPAGEILVGELTGSGQTSTSSSITLDKTFLLSYIKIHNLVLIR